eukprot:TRINITY_DN611_c0_g1_i4.p1 TRINITY_DN611_c0_g1~~TRINITY_DN611_c0_g1_i4.p1  ORF type:complete len:108 (+),score=5.76 TRINITY_DN611_c0_g1_i4:73-396(+)
MCIRDSSYSVPLGPQKMMVSSSVRSLSCITTYLLIIRLAMSFCFLMFVCTAFIPLKSYIINSKRFYIYAGYNLLPCYIFNSNTYHSALLPSSPVSYTHLTLPTNREV